MKIALFHNLGAGGAKRHLYEQIRELTTRGHTVDLYLTADVADPQEFLPLAPFCRSVKTYGPHPLTPSPVAPPQPLPTGEGSTKRFPEAPPPQGEGGSPQASREGPSAREGLGMGRGLKRALIERIPALKAVSEWRQVRSWLATLDRLSAHHARIAQDIDTGGYDVAYIAQCRWMLAPDVLRFLRRTPTVFCCHDTLRSVVEWPVTTPADYDVSQGTPFLRKSLGRRYLPAGFALAEREARRFERNTRAADVVLANSFFSRERLVGLTGVDARVCYPGVDGDFFCPDPLTPRDEQLVVCIGALLPGKRHDFVIEAVATIPATCRPRVLIVGYGERFGEARLGGEGERLVQLAADKKVEFSVQPEVTDEVIRAAYRRAGVVAFAPYLEPFGLVALEAAACGAPVVGVAEGGVRETVRDGETGYLTDHDPVLFGTALKRVLGDADIARRMGARGRELARTEWTWYRCVDTLERQLAHAAAEKRNRSGT